MNFVKTGYKPLKIQAQRNRIVTISTKLELSWIFDDEVNEYLEQGWKLDRIETVKKDSDILLIGFLKRY